MADKSNKEPVAEAAPAEPVMSATAYAEEHPRLRREARDILARLYGQDRKTEAEWTGLAETYGGERP